MGSEFYPRKGAIVLKSGHSTRDSKSARLKERDQFTQKVG